MFSKKAHGAEDPTQPATPEPQPVTPATAADNANPTGRKAGPTPRRKDAEARNKVPLVPGDRRAAAKARRARDRELREAQYKAMQTGDERGLPLRDKGPVRRYIRDYVDARRSLGEYFLVIALTFMVLIMFTSQAPPIVAFIITIALYLIVFGTIADAFVMWRGLKRKLVAKFGEDAVNKSLRWYAIMRVFQIRRARLPKPLVKHGQYPS